jgi:hypothetical protein
VWRFLHRSHLTACASLLLDMYANTVSVTCSGLAEKYLPKRDPNEYDSASQGLVETMGTRHYTPPVRSRLLFLELVRLHAVFFILSRGLVCFSLLLLRSLRVVFAHCVVGFSRLSWCVLCRPRYQDAG